MWVAIKYNQNELNLLKSELDRICNNSIFYFPKLIYSKKNKFFVKNILQDYLFCYHKNFTNSVIINKIKRVKGLKYIFENSHLNQNKITSFINFLKGNEDKGGFIKSDFFFNLSCNKVKFLDGPLSNLVLEILDKNKKFIKFNFGNKILKLNRKLNLSVGPS